MKAVRIQSQGALRTAERTQNLNIIIWPHKSYGKYREHRLLNLILVNRYVCLYFPVARLMAVEDELRGGAIPDIKPRILTDQVCACVYIFLSSLLAKPVMSSNSLHHSCITSRAFAKKSQGSKVMHSTCSHLSKVHVDVAAFHHSLYTRQGGGGIGLI